MKSVTSGRPDSAFTVAVEVPRKKEDTSFGPRLTAIRKSRGLTQIQLAQDARCSQRSISYCEKDDGLPPASVGITLAKALKVPPMDSRSQTATERVNDDTETKRLWKKGSR